jgi:hypothetical protein
VPSVATQVYLQWLLLCLESWTVAVAVAVVVTVAAVAVAVVVVVFVVFPVTAAVFAGAAEGVYSAVVASPANATDNRPNRQSNSLSNHRQRHQTNLAHQILLCNAPLSVRQVKFMETSGYPIWCAYFKLGIQRLSAHLSLSIEFLP